MTRMPLPIQGLVIFLVLFATGSWWYATSLDETRLSTSVAKARVAVDQIQTSMEWVAQNNGIWFAQAPGIPFGNKRDNVTVYPPYSPQGVPRDEYRFHQRSPSSVVAELAEIMIKSGQLEGAEVLTASSNTPATPRPQRDAYVAIAGDPNNEYAQVVGGSLVYARALKVTTACLSCHESIERAPAPMRDKFRHVPTMFGYKPGAFVGALAVSIQLKTDVPTRAKFSHLYAPALFLCACLFALIWSVFAILIPARKLARFTRAVISADLANPPSELHLASNVHKSWNELHIVNDGVNVLLRSQQLPVTPPSLDSNTTNNRERRFGSSELGDVY